MKASIVEEVAAAGASISRSDATDATDATDRDTNSR